MNKLKTKEEVLAAFKKSNYTRKEYLANRAGFDSIQKYKDFLEKGVKEGGEKKEVSRCFEPNKKEGKETVHLVNIVDLSSSMSGSRIDSVNKSLKMELKELAKDTNVNYVYSLITFSYSFQIFKVLDKAPIGEVNLKDLVANGMTALNDAVGQTLSNLIDNKNQGRVVVSIFTDGEENSSTSFTKGDVATLVKQAEKSGIVVTFIGTEEDTKKVTRDFLVDVSNTVTHNNTAETISMSFHAKLGSTRSYSNKVSKGVKQEDLLTGFYKKSGKL